MLKEIVSVFRVLRYVGPRDWIKTTLNVRGVKGRHQITEDKYIEEAILGEFPETVKEIKAKET